MASAALFSLLINAQDSTCTRRTIRKTVRETDVVHTKAKHVWSSLEPPNKTCPITHTQTLTIEPSTCLPKTVTSTISNSSNLQSVLAGNQASIDLPLVNLEPNTTYIASGDVSVSFPGPTHKQKRQSLHCRLTIENSGNVIAAISLEKSGIAHYQTQQFLPRPESTLRYTEICPPGVTPPVIKILNVLLRPSRLHLSGSVIAEDGNVQTITSTVRETTTVRNESHPITVTALSTTTIFMDHNRTLSPLIQNRTVYETSTFPTTILQNQTLAQNQSVTVTSLSTTTIYKEYNETIHPSNQTVTVHRPLKVEENRTIYETTTPTPRRVCIVTGQPL